MEPPPVKAPKPLPKPDDPPRKKRGGRRWAYYIAKKFSECKQLHAGVKLWNTNQTRQEWLHDHPYFLCHFGNYSCAHEDCLAHGRLWREQWWLSAGAWVVLWVTAASLLLSIACRYGLFLVCWSCRVHEQYWVCVAHWSMSYIVIGTEHGSYRLSYTQKAGKWAVLSLYDHGDVKDDFVVRYLNGMNYCIHLLEHE